MFAAGCVTPPATDISFNPNTKQFHLVSPKQVKATKLSVTAPDGTIVAIENLDSANDPAIITAVSAYQLQQSQQILDALNKIATAVGAGATKAVIP